MRESWGRSGFVAWGFVCGLCLVRPLVAASGLVLPASPCDTGGLTLKLAIKTDNGLSKYEQALELSLSGAKTPDATAPVGVARNPVREYEVPVNNAHCRAWMKIHGTHLPATMALLGQKQSPRPAQGKDRVCDRMGYVTVNSKGQDTTAEVCITIGLRGDQKTEAFRKLYDSTELFVSTP